MSLRKRVFSSSVMPTSKRLPVLTQAYTSNTHHARFRVTGLSHGLITISTVPICLMALVNVPVQNVNGFSDALH
jgi:Na+/melibiose symporter-like transporter